MSSFLRTALSHTANVYKIYSSRLLHKVPLVLTIKETFSLRSSAIKAFCPANKTGRLNYSDRGYNINTNVEKDVILFKYENPKFYNLLNIFALCQFVFWTYLSHFAFTTLKDAPIEDSPDVELKWYQRINLGENKYRNGITIVSFLIGYGILFAAWMFTLRSVRFLILRKGGRSVAFVTYGPFNKNRIMTVPLTAISAQESRQAAKVQLPIKVRDRTLFYILDMRGEFRNPELFDYTAGLKRRI